MLRVLLSTYEWQRWLLFLPSSALSFHRFVLANGRVLRELHRDVLAIQRRFLCRAPHAQFLIAKCAGRPRQFL